jgi:putative SOS response-associated peptidase YedK
MCGRYQRRCDKQKIAEAYQLGNVDGLSLELAPDYNAAPQSTQTVIIWDEAGGMRMVRMMFWRFLAAICHRAEEVPTRYHQCPRRVDPRQQCVARGLSAQSLPCSRGFFIEWKRIDPKTKLPWVFAMKNDEPFALAGV